MRRVLGAIATVLLVPAGALPLIYLADWMADGHKMGRAALASVFVVIWLALCAPLVERAARGGRG